MKKDDNNLAGRGLKLFRSLVGSRAFESGVKEIRAKYNKPYNELGRKKISFERDVVKLIDELKLPNTYWWHKILADYIESNEVIEPDMGHPFIGFLKRVNRDNGGYTEWRFYYGIAQRDLDYLLKKWFIVTPAHIPGTRKKIQPERDPETTEKLLAEWGKKQGKGYKEILVAKKVPPPSKRKDWSGAVKARVYRKRNKTR